MRYAYQVHELKGEKLLKLFKGYSKAVVQKHCKKFLEGELKENKWIGSKTGCLAGKKEPLDNQRW